MTIWHIEGRRKIPCGAQCGVIAVCVLALFISAVYPDPAKAALINDDVPQAYRDPRDPFLFRPALSRVGLNADACALASYQADVRYFSKGGEQARANTEQEAGLEDLAYLSSGRVFRGGEDPALGRMVWERNSLGLGVRLADGSFSDLRQIETRVENIGNCLKYMQYLVNSIRVIFNFTQGKSITAFDRNVGSSSYIFVFRESENAVANSSVSPDAVSEAGAISTNVPKFVVTSTLAAILNEDRGKTTRSSSGRTDVSIFNSSRPGAPGTQRQKPRRPKGLKNILKRFLGDIFSQAYTYVLMVVVFGFGLFLRSRV